MGLSSMAGFMGSANSNDLVMEFACKELLKQAGEIPVFFGYNATDTDKAYVRIHTGNKNPSVLPESGPTIRRSA